MRIIITENQADKFLRKYINKLITYPEYEWVDKIEVTKTTTKELGWVIGDEKPLYWFTVYVNPEHPFSEEDENNIYNEIGRIHNMLFPVIDSSNPESYFSIDFTVE